MELNSRSMFILFMLFFMFFTPVGTPPRLLTPRERKDLNNYLARQHQELGFLSNSTWGDHYNMLTGLKEYPVNPANPGSVLPAEVFDSARAVWNMEKELVNTSSYYINVTASLRGSWEKLQAALLPINLTTPHPKNVSTELYNSPVYLEQAFDGKFSSNKIGNITSPTGKMEINMEQLGKKSADWNVSVIELQVDLSDSQENQHDKVRLRGVYLKKTGNMVFASNSLKFSGAMAVPHLIITGEYFEEAKDAMVDLRNRSLHNLEGMDFADEAVKYSVLEEAIVTSHKCEFIGYGHLHSVPVSPNELKTIEEELENPLGRPHKPVPGLQLDIVLYSPDCALAASTKQPLLGELDEEYSQRTKNIVMLGILLLFGQTLLTALQMKDTSTPSTISRVSFYSIALMSVLDGATFITAFAFSIIESVALSFLAAAFIAFALTAVFELRYMVLIYRSQIYESWSNGGNPGNEESAGLIARPDGRLVGPQQNELSDSDENATQQEQNRMPVDDERHVMSLIYNRFYPTLLLFMIVSVVSLSWPQRLRRIYEYSVLLALYSFWFPQIYRNTKRGTRRSFLWRFIFSTSVIRLLPILYITLDPGNILYHRCDYKLAAILSGWVALQMLFLGAQAILGPRFLLPKGYLPALYDYHPVITEDDLENGLEYNSDAPGGQPAKQNPATDCAICMMPISLVIQPRDGSQASSNPASLLARRKYMVTPCRHVFHTQCMEKWMRTRLQCPVCRNPLPPI